MNNGKKNIILGAWDLRGIADDNIYFVDKTLFIKEWFENKSMVTLITRPEGFGKTLNISMLRRFFEDEITDHGERADNRYLFDGLDISRCSEGILNHQQQYPVIFLSLQFVKFSDFETALYVLLEEIKNEFHRHEYVLESDSISEEQKETYRSFMTKKTDSAEYIDSLAFLSEILAACHSKNTIILIDEYDTPLRYAFREGYYGEMADFLRRLFESTFNTNPYLERGIIAGHLQIDRENIFRSFDDLDTDTVLHTRYSDFFGFREDEVKAMLEYYEIYDCMAEVKEWYDGYFVGDSKLYTPWSILEYIKDHIYYDIKFLKPYWFHRPSGNIIREMLDDPDSQAKDDIEILIEKKTIRKPVQENIIYETLHADNDNLWNYLFFTGYLKMTGMHMYDETTYLDLAVPNKEVETRYIHIVSRWFDMKMHRIDNGDLLNALEQGDCKAVEDFIRRFLMNSISWLTRSKDFYNRLIRACFAKTDRYAVNFNRECDDDMPDILLRNYFSKIYRAIILNIRVADNENQLEAKCDEALQDIEDKKYAEQFIGTRYNIVQKYGISFYKKECMVKQGETYKKMNDYK